MTDKPAIVISIPLVWGVRNTLRSGLHRQLAEQFRVIVAVPEAGREDLLNEGVAESDLWILENPRETPRQSRLMKTLKQAHAWRFPTPSDKIFDRWGKAKAGGPNGGARAALGEAAFKGLGLLTAPGPLFNWLERQEETAYAAMIPPRVWELLRETKPVFGLSTSHVVNWEWALFRAMHALGIPVAAQILSFDNLTTRGYLPTKHFRHFLVWQNRMGGELQKFYGIAADRITVTGTPQFDFHVRPDRRWPRDRTAQAVGLDPVRPYFVYCANTQALTPREPELVAAILKQTAGDARFARHQWLLRLHPLDDYQRWEPLVREFAHVRLNRPWSQSTSATFWATPSDDELGFLGNILRYADATLTMASSIALDSAVVDTPVICVGFHPRAGSAEDTFYREAHYSHHYAPISSSPAAPVVTDINLLIAALHRAVTDRGAQRAARAQLVADVCGCVDGHAADRIAAAVVEMVNATTNTVAREVLA